MILSNISIHKALDQGRLVIIPEPLPRRLQLTDVSAKCPYQTSAVDLCLGDEIACFNRGNLPPVQIDLRKGNFNTLFAPFSTTCKLTEEQPYVLQAQQACIRSDARGRGVAAFCRWHLVGGPC